MHSEKQMGTILKGAVILSLSSLVAKILSALYRIPFENLVGNLGFYVYQQVYPIYGIGMTFALSGFPVFISKLVIEAKNPDAQRGLAQQAMIVLSGFALLIFAGLQWQAGPLAGMMGDPGLTVLIKSVSWMFLFMPFLAVGRGYYQGRMNMIPTAVSQISEQVVRVAMIVGVAIIAVHLHWPVYKMGAWAMFGATCGAVAALLSFSAFLFGLLKKGSSLGQSPYTFSRLAQRLFTEGLVMCLFASVMVIFQLVDSFTVKKVLVDSGMPQMAAKALKGTYDRAQPLVQVGTVAALGFSTTLIPALSRAISHKNQEGFRKIAALLMKISLTVSIAAALGLAALMPAINTLLFKDSALSAAISVYCLSIIFVTVITNYNSILQSLNCFWLSVWGLAGGLVVKAITNVILIRHLGIMGASLATLLGLIATQVIIMAFLPANLKGLLNDGTFWRKLSWACLTLLIFAGLVMIAGRHLTAASRLGSALVTLIGVAAGAGAFLGMVFATQLFTDEEWASIPGGGKMLAVWNKIRRN